MDEYLVILLDVEHGLSDQSPAHRAQRQPAVLYQLPRVHRPGDGLHQGRSRRVDRRRQAAPHPLPHRRAARPRRREKKTPSRLMSRLRGLLVTTTRAATSSPACARRLYEHMLAALVSPCRGTITNLICLCGRSHLDWTADYRLYSHERVEPALLFGHIVTEIHRHLPADAPVVTAIDDTLARKSGPKIDGVGWKRDPLGPAFQTNLVRGQRFVQLSAAWAGPDGQARMIPVDFTHAPTPTKPGKRASAAAQKQYKEQKRQQRLNAVALARI